MSAPDTQETRESCRREVLRYMAERPQLAFRDQTIQQKLSHEHGFTIDQVRDALVFLKSSKLVDFEPDGLGATLFYKITAQGILFHERNF